MDRALPVRAAGADLGLNVQVKPNLARYIPNALVLSLLALHFSSFSPSTQPLVTDIRFFVYFAWRIGEGAVPHLDYFENKTQLAAYCGALLHKLGEALSIDPLQTLRIGYLTIAAGAGALLYSIFRRLGGGATAGALAVCAYCSFGLLGLLPAIGNVPKLLMATLASAGALLIFRRAWYLAGVSAALAFMDWQVGGLAGVAALLCAARDDTGRGRAMLRVIGGGLTGIAPFLAFYAANGALGAFFSQIVGSSFARGSATLAQVGFIERLQRIAEVTRIATPQQNWLFYLAWAGLPLVVFFCWRWRGEERGRLLLPLTIYHLGAVAFSLTDYQYYGDHFLLLHSAVFFLAALWVALFQLARQLLSPRTAAIALTLLALAAARPGALRPRLQLEQHGRVVEATLTDQRQVARELEAQVGEGALLFLEHTELLYLMRRENAIPLVYWNIPAWSALRRNERESFAEGGLRTMLSAPAVAVAAPKRLSLEPLRAAGFEVREFSSVGGRYRVELALKTGATR